MAESDVARRLAHAYVSGWKTADSRAILDTLTPDCVIIESHGARYQRIEQVERWVESWFGEGNTIERWDVTSLLVANEACAFEWVCSYSTGKSQNAFEGASLARFSGDRIALLREYRMTNPRHPWAG